MAELTLASAARWPVYRAQDWTWGVSGEGPHVFQIKSCTRKDACCGEWVREGSPTEPVRIPPGDGWRPVLLRGTLVSDTYLITLDGRRRVDCLVFGTDEPEQILWETWPGKDIRTPGLDHHSWWGLTRFTRRLGELLDQLDVEGKTIVDLGCGQKPYLPLLYRKRAGAYLGVDLETNYFADVVVRPGERYPLEDGCADIVLAFSLLEHVEDPKFVVEETARLLKPRGWLVVVTPFAYLYHPTPDDYWRFTRAAFPILLGDQFEVELIEQQTNTLQSILVAFNAYLEFMGPKTEQTRSLRIFVNRMVEAAEQVPELRLPQGGGEFPQGYLVLARKRA